MNHVNGDPDVDIQPAPMLEGDEPTEGNLRAARGRRARAQGRRGELKCIVDIVANTAKDSNPGRAIRGQRGWADVLAGINGQSYAIQVKTDQRSPWVHFGPKDRARLLEFAASFGAIPEVWWNPFDRKGWRRYGVEDWPKARQTSGLDVAA